MSLTERLIKYETSQKIDISELLTGDMLSLLDDPNFLETLKENLSKKDMEIEIMIGKFSDLTNIITATLESDKFSDDEKIIIMYTTLYGTIPSYIRELVFKIWINELTKKLAGLHNEGRFEELPEEKLVDQSGGMRLTGNNITYALMLVVQLIHNFGGYANADIIQGNMRREENKDALRDMNRFVEGLYESCISKPSEKLPGQLSCSDSSVSYDYILGELNKIDPAITQSLITFAKLPDYVKDGNMDIEDLKVRLTEYSALKENTVLPTTSSGWVLPSVSSSIATLFRGNTPREDLVEIIKKKYTDEDPLLIQHLVDILDNKENKDKSTFTPKETLQILNDVSNYYFEFKNAINKEKINQATENEREALELERKALESKRQADIKANEEAQQALLAKFEEKEEKLASVLKVEELTLQNLRKQSVRSKSEQKALQAAADSIITNIKNSRDLVSYTSTSLSQSEVSFGDKKLNVTDDSTQLAGPLTSISTNEVAYQGQMTLSAKKVKTGAKSDIEIKMTPNEVNVFYINFKPVLYGYLKKYMTDWINTLFFENTSSDIAESSNTTAVAELSGSELSGSEFRTRRVKSFGRDTSREEGVNDTTSVVVSDPGERKVLAPSVTSMGQYEASLDLLNKLLLESILIDENKISEKFTTEKWFLLYDKVIPLQVVENITKQFDNTMSQYSEHLSSGIETSTINKKLNEIWPQLEGELLKSISSFEKKCATEREDSICLNLREANAEIFGKDYTESTGILQRLSDKISSDTEELKRLEENYTKEMDKIEEIPGVRLVEKDDECKHSIEDKVQGLEIATTVEGYTTKFPVTACVVARRAEGNSVVKQDTDISSIQNAIDILSEITEVSERLNKNKELVVGLLDVRRENFGALLFNPEDQTGSEIIKKSILQQLEPKISARTLFDVGGKISQMEIKIGGTAEVRRVLKPFIDALEDTNKQNHDIILQDIATCSGTTTEALKVFGFQYSSITTDKCTPEQKKSLQIAAGNLHASRLKAAKFQAIASLSDQFVLLLETENDPNKLFRNLESFIEFIGSQTFTPDEKVQHAAMEEAQFNRIIVAEANQKREKQNLESNTRELELLQKKALQARTSLDIQKELLAAKYSEKALKAWFDMLDGPDYFGFQRIALAVSGFNEAYGNIIKKNVIITVIAIVVTGISICFGSAYITSSIGTLFASLIKEPLVQALNVAGSGLVKVGTFFTYIDQHKSSFIPAGLITTMAGYICQIFNVSWPVTIGTSILIGYAGEYYLKMIFTIPSPDPKQTFKVSAVFKDGVLTTNSLQIDIVNQFEGKKKWIKERNMWKSGPQNKLYESDEKGIPIPIKLDDNTYLLPVSDNTAYSITSVDECWIIKKDTDFDSLFTNDEPFKFGTTKFSRNQEAQDVLRSINLSGDDKWISVENMYINRRKKLIFPNYYVQDKVDIVSILRDIKFPEEVIEGQRKQAEIFRSICGNSKSNPRISFPYSEGDSPYKAIRKTTFQQLVRRHKEGDRIPYHIQNAALESYNEPGLGEPGLGEPGLGELGFGGSHKHYKTKRFFKKKNKNTKNYKNRGKTTKNYRKKNKDTLKHKRRKINSLRKN